MSFLAPGKGRVISITADATHFVNCGGYIRLLDCTFENQKDDATNIHGLYMPVDSMTAPDRALLRWGHAGQYGVDFLVPGMRVEVVDNMNLETYAHLTVESVNRINKNYTEVKFAEPLPERAGKSHLIAADEDYPKSSFAVAGCRETGARALARLPGTDRYRAQLLPYSRGRCSVRGRRQLLVRAVRGARRVDTR